MNPHLWVYIMDPRCCLYWQFPWYFVCLVFQARDGQKNCHQKCGMIPLYPVLLGKLAHGVMSVPWRWEAGVWNQGALGVLLFINVIRKNYTRSLNIHISPYPDVNVIKKKSSSQKSVDAAPTGTLDSCSGPQNEQRNTQNNVIGVEIRTVSM